MYPFPTDNTIVFTALKFCAYPARRRLLPLLTALIAHTLTVFWFAWAVGSKDIGRFQSLTLVWCYMPLSALTPEIFPTPVSLRGNQYSAGTRYIVKVDVDQCQKAYLADTT